MGGTDNKFGGDVAVDTAGNVYAAGYFSGTVDFDPGPGSANLTSAGSYDIYVCKLNRNGKFVWAKSMGGPQEDRLYSITVDTAGNVYTTGYFQGTADFDPGPGTADLVAAGVSGDVFVSKLDSSGNYVWAKAMGGSGMEYGAGIAVDSSGNVYTAGYFWDVADFDPGAGTANLASTGRADIFVSKLDSSGSHVWARSMGGAEDDIAVEVAVDSFGNVYTAGHFWGTADFDPGPGTFNLTSAGSSDLFVSKLDSSGSYLWAKSMGGFGLDNVTGMTIDSDGNVYTTGYFNNSADFDPGPGTAYLTSAGGADTFISKLDSDGAFVWIRGMGGPQGDYGDGIALDSTGNIYTVGAFYASGDYDPGPGGFTLSSSGDSDIFISKLDSGGNFVWAKAMGGPATDYGHGIAADARANPIVTGNFRDTADFDPGPGIYNLSSGVSDDIFVAKLGEPPAAFVWPMFLPAVTNSSPGR